MFENMFKAIWDKHASIKSFQQHRNYNPYLSEDTKKLMKDRDNLRKRATNENNNDLFEQYKIKRNLVKKCLQKDKKEYYERKFNIENNKTTKNTSTWKKTRTRFIIIYLFSKFQIKMRCEKDYIPMPKFMTIRLQRLVAADKSLEHPADTFSGPYIRLSAA